jgi:uncharacterized membrane protein
MEQRVGATTGRGHGTGEVTIEDPEVAVGVRAASGIACAGVLLLLLHLNVGRLDLLNDVIGAWLLLVAIARLPEPGGGTEPGRAPEADRAVRRRFELLGLGLLLAVLLVEVSVWTGRTAPGGGVEVGTAAGAAPDVLVGVAATLLTVAVQLALAARFARLTAGDATLARSWTTTRWLLRWLLVPALSLLAIVGVAGLGARGAVGGASFEVGGGGAMLLVMPLLVATLAPQLHLCVSLWRTRGAASSAGSATRDAPRAAADGLARGGT